jgi:hypothetical protein
MLFQFGLFNTGGIDPTTIGPTEFLQLLLRVINIALALIGIVAFVYILVAGLQYITAGGNDAKQGEAKKALQAAIIGVIIVMLSFSLTTFLLRTLGLKDTIKQDNPAVKDIIK